MNALDELDRSSRRCRRPWLSFLSATLLAVILFTAGGPALSFVRISTTAAPNNRRADYTGAAVPTTASVRPAAATPTAAPTAVATSPPRPRCGNGLCELPETVDSCFEDCPGVTTPAMCGEEPHSDPGGEAVAWGLTHKTTSAAECCERCAAHAADPKNAKKPCNSWVFCHMPQCWSLDTGAWLLHLPFRPCSPRLRSLRFACLAGHQHKFGECWLKWQVDAKHPLYGQRGRYSDDFRKRHARAHMVGTNSDGSRRNLSVPTHVPWCGLTPPLPFTPLSQHTLA